jgi:UDP-N-acetylglucosamine transferase subunit ALG13
MSPPRLLVIVGTDHHPFDRLISWVDDWLAGRDDIGWAVVQHGRSRPPQHAQARPLLGHSELQELVRSATLVVTHGGPATILEVRSHGILPITVPRNPRLGEHVDDHQQRFARMLGGQGLVRLAETADELEAALIQGCDEPTAFRIAVEQDSGGQAPAAVTRIGSIIDDLVEGARVRRRRRPRRTPPRSLGANTRVAEPLTRT